MLSLLRYSSVVVAAASLLAASGCTEPREPVGAVPSDQSALATTGAQESQPQPRDHDHDHDHDHPPAARPGESDLLEDTDSSASVDSQGRLRVGGLAWRSPEGWMPQAPQTAFAEWEYVLPGAEEGTEALLTMGYTGGTVEENVTRWQAQLSNARDEEVRRLENTHVPVTLYRARGTLRGRTDNMTVALLFDYQANAEIPPLVYVRVNGPEETVRTHLDRIKHFGKTAEPESHLEPAEQDE